MRRRNLFSRRPSLVAVDLAEALSLLADARMADAPPFQGAACSIANTLDVVLHGVEVAIRDDVCERVPATIDAITAMEGVR